MYPLQAARGAPWISPRSWGRKGCADPRRCHQRRGTLPLPGGSPPGLLSPAEPLGAGQRREPRSFRSCLFSQRFAWHLVWLSVIQLWHYLFIGTLNSLLTNLAGGDKALGTWQGWEAARLHAQLGLDGAGAELGRAVRVGAGARGGGPGRAWAGWEESCPAGQSWRLLTTQPLSALCSQQLHQRLCHHSVLRRAVCPLEWAAHGPAAAEVPEGGSEDR